MLISSLFLLPLLFYNEMKRGTHTQNSKTNELADSKVKNFEKHPGLYHLWAAVVGVYEQFAAS